ncbi:TPA: ATP-dependent zinc protease [Pseudomonas aeruginosa]
MKLKPLAPLLCLFIAVPGLSVAAEKTVYGLNEYARINDPDIQLAAKLDTGAKTASLSARDIKRFKRDGETWVRFCLATDNADDTPIEKPLARISKIKRRHGDFNPDEGKAYTARPVIELQVCMGKAIRTIEVNLTDRSAFQYPLLIGSEALKKFDALVDPSLKYSAGKPGCKPDAKPAE